MYKARNVLKSEENYWLMMGKFNSISWVYDVLWTCKIVTSIQVNVYVGAIANFTRYLETNLKNSFKLT